MTELFLAQHVNSDKYFTCGSSRKLLSDFFAYLDREKSNISELYLCLYLYNNSVLHQKMKEMAESGISVKVISIPLEGYDANYPKKIVDPDTGNTVFQNATKYSLAKRVYDDAARLDNQNFSLYVFGHTFVRSRRFKNFSRGTLPYSLHTKSIFIKMRDGRSVTGLTSCNLAVRDASKDELMVLKEDTTDSRKNSELFFKQLIAYSVPVAKWKNPCPHFTYSMDPVEEGAFRDNYYSAPFFKDSPARIEQRLAEIINSARRRIIICAEHIAAFDYEDLQGRRKLGILGAAFRKCQEGVKVTCLSQTYVDARGDSHGQLSPQNTKMFRHLMQYVDSLPDCDYLVNRNVHEKFIIVDDTVIFSTGNYTPTEFVYGKVKINSFESSRLAGVTYEGIFSEVSHFMVIQDREIARKMVESFSFIVKDKDTYRHQKMSRMTPEQQKAAQEKMAWRRPELQWTDRMNSARRKSARWKPGQQKPAKQATVQKEAVRQDKPLQSPMQKDAVQQKPEQKDMVRHRSTQKDSAREKGHQEKAADKAASPNKQAGQKKKFYINCPYKEKEEAKALGAKWDPSCGLWYYESDKADPRFQKWHF